MGEAHHPTQRTSHPPPSPPCSNGAWQGCDAAAYAAHCERRLAEEAARCELYLEPATRAPLVALVERCLVQRHLGVMLTCDFERLLAQERVDDLARLYRHACACSLCVCVCFGGGWEGRGDRSGAREVTHTKPAYALTSVQAGRACGHGPRPA